MMDANESLVTIIIPVFNHETFLAECIESVIAQDYEEIQIIIVDDGSKDASYKKLLALENKIANRFNDYLLKTHENIGLTATLEWALSKTRGEFVVIFASDDVMHHKRISHQVRVLQECGGDALVGACPLYRADVDLENLTIRKNTKLIKPSSIYRYFYDLPAPGLIYRRKVVDTIGGYPSDIILEDKYFFLLACHHGFRIFKDQTIASYYRVHGGNQHVSTSRMNDGRRQIASISREIGRPHLSEIELDLLQDLHNRKLSRLHLLKLVLTKKIHPKLRLLILRKIFGA